MLICGLLQGQPFLLILHPCWHVGTVIGGGYVPGLATVGTVYVPVRDWPPCTAEHIHHCQLTQSDES